MMLNYVEELVKVIGGILAGVGSVYWFFVRKKKEEKKTIDTMVKDLFNLKMKITDLIRESVAMETDIGDICVALIKLKDKCPDCYKSVLDDLDDETIITINRRVKAVS